MQVKIPPEERRRKDVPLSDYIWLETISPTKDPPDDWETWESKQIRGRTYWFKVNEIKK